MGDIELKCTGLEIGSDAKVVEVAKATSHALSKLKDAIDRLHGGVGQAGFHEGEDSVPTLFDCSS